MKARHWVTLGVVLLAGALLAGIFLRLRDAGEEGGGGDGDPAADSVRAAIQSTAAQAAFATEIAVPVEGAVARRDTFVLWVAAAGRAAALRRAPLYAEVAGPVLEVPVREGQLVRAGQLIARVDSTEYALQARERAAELERAHAQFQELTLFDDEIEDPELRRERERLARVRSGLAGAEAALERARLELAKTEIRAPFAGVVANLAITSGTRLRQGDSVAVVLDLSRVDVDVNVLETQITHVERGRRARATLPALPGEEFVGRVVTVNPMVDPQTNTGRVTVRLENPGTRIHPGMYAEVRLAGRLLEDRVFLPREAVVERDRREVVFVFEPDEPGSDTGRAKWTYVRPGAENERLVEIAPPTEDYHADPATLVGRIVLVDGHATLVHDARVRIENAESLRAGSGGGASGGAADSATGGGR